MLLFTRGSSSTTHSIADAGCGHWVCGTCPDLALADSRRRIVLGSGESICFTMSDRENTLRIRLVPIPLGLVPIPLGSAF